MSTVLRADDKGASLFVQAIRLPRRTVAMYLSLNQLNRTRNISLFILSSLAVHAQVWLAMMLR